MTASSSETLRVPKSQRKNVHFTTKRPLQTVAELYAELKSLKNINPNQSQIDEISDKVFRTSMIVDKRLREMDYERDSLKKYVDNIWKIFENIVIPFWKVHESLAPMYDDLSLIYQELVSIESSQLTASERNVKIQNCQESLNALESNNSMNEKFVPLGWNKLGGNIPSGQAIISTILNKCYRKVHLLLERESDFFTDMEYIAKDLEHIISELVLLRGLPEFDMMLNPQELLSFQKQLQKIDLLQVDGKFLDDSGNIPEGQANVHTLLETAYDVAHDCVLLLEEQESKMDTSEYLLESLVNRLSDAKDSLLNISRSTETVVVEKTLTNLGMLANIFSEGTEKIKEFLEIPKKTMSSTMLTLASLARSGLRMLSNLYAEIEPVDQSLLEILIKLQDIRGELYKIRNEFDVNFVKKFLAENAISGQAMMVRYKNKLEILHGRLEEIEAGKKDGYFVSNIEGNIKSGQNHLKSLMEECYCLLYEAKDRMITEISE